MSNAIVPTTPSSGDIVEAVLTKGDLSKLSPDERNRYYLATCNSLGLNPLTRPFEFLVLSGKTVLYAKRDAADQLRKINGVSIEIVSQTVADGVLTVRVRATDKTGRCDEDYGAVALPDNLKGEARANTVMKAITKAKRRVTLSISGLGFLDETEVDDIPAPQPPRSRTGFRAPPCDHDPITGEIVEPDAEMDSEVRDNDHEAEEAAISVHDIALAEAASNGVAALAAAWRKVPPKFQHVLEAAKNRRFKPRAMEVDAARHPAEAAE